MQLLTLLLKYTPHEHIQVKEHSIIPSTPRTFVEAVVLPKAGLPKATLLTHGTRGLLRRAVLCGIFRAGLCPLDVSTDSLPSPAHPAVRTERTPDRRSLGVENL